ncbi:hypothetical protein D3C81_1245200 [compost metagenome]
MLFVHHDQPQTVKRSKDRRACADGHLHATLANFTPFVVTFAGGQAAVHHRYLRAETPLKPFDHLRG